MAKRLQEIASDLGVSTATVSRVINNKSGVRADTRETVLRYLAAQGRVARDNASFKDIGIVDTFLPHRLDNYYISKVIEGADERIHAMNCITALVHADIIEKELLAYGRADVLNRLEGILWMEPMFNRRFYDIVKERNLPCVVINNCEEDIPIDFIKSDNLASSKKAIRFLIENGHRSIGFIGGYLHLTNHKDRFQGYREGLEEAGIESDPRFVITDITSWDAHGGAEGVYRILSRGEFPSAIMLCSDFLAEGAYEAVKTKGLRIPDQVSIVSFDDFPPAERMDPPLTTFRQPLQEIGKAAANRLFEIIANPQVEMNHPKHTLVDCPLKLRNSIRLAQ
jgi:DNA-binding LacI/PurR family transcriptional regulator